jgi:hypothetical protein
VKTEKSLGLLYQIGESLLKREEGGREMFFSVEEVSLEQRKSAKFIRIRKTSDEQTQQGNETFHYFNRSSSQACMREEVEESFFLFTKVLGSCLHRSQRCWLSRHQSTTRKFFLS